MYEKVKGSFPLFHSIFSVAFFNEGINKKINFCNAIKCKLHNIMINIFIFIYFH